MNEKLLGMHLILENLDEKKEGVLMCLREIFESVWMCLELVSAESRGRRKKKRDFA